MAPRASWKGYLKLSLVSCPVRLYPATSASERITFNQLHKKTHNRINMKPVDPELGLVERSDLVKGYEYEDKKYIIIEDSDLEAVRIESNHTMNIEAFVDEGAVDVIYQDAPYYLAPDGAMAEETFIVLREAMRKTGKLAIARLVLSSRERVVTIGARENGMFVCTLRNPERSARHRRIFRHHPGGNAGSGNAAACRSADQAEADQFRSEELRGSLRGSADEHDPREAEGPQADHRGSARARQRHQPDGCAEGQPVAGEAAGQDEEQGRRSAGEARSESGGGRRQGCRCRQGRRQGQEVTAAGKTFGTVGALAAFPRRLAAREVERQHGSMARGVTRRTTHLVFGRSLLGRGDDARTEARFQAERRAGRQLLSENGFLRLLGLLKTPGGIRAFAAVAARPVEAAGRVISTCCRCSTRSSTTASPSPFAT